MSSKHARSITDKGCATRDNSGTRPAQMSLRYNDRYQDSEKWQEVLDEITAIIGASGLKQAAYDLDQQPSVLAHALAERDRHYVRAEWLVYLIRTAPNDRLVQLLADIRGLEVRQAHEMTPAEKLQRLTAELERSPLIAEAIYRGAFGPKGRP